MKIKITNIFKLFFTIGPLLSFTASDAAISHITPVTSNQTHVLKQLESIKNPSADENAILVELGNERPDQALHSLNQLSGQQFTNLVLSAEIANRQFIRRLYEPVREISSSHLTPQCGCEAQMIFDAWTQISGNESVFQGDKNASKIRMSGYEAVVGAQLLFDQTFVVGAAVSYEVDHLNFHIGGSGKNEVALGALYSFYRHQFGYVMADLVLGYSQDKVNRKIKIEDLTYHAKSRPKIHQGTLYIETGLDYFWQYITIQPFLGFEIGHYHQLKIKEYNADPLNLSINHKSHTNAYGNLGLHFTTRKRPETFIFGLDIYYQYRVTSLSNKINENFITFGSPFAVNGFSMSRHSFEGRARLSKDFCRNWEWFAEIAGQSWFSGFSYGVTGGLQTTW